MATCIFHMGYAKCASTLLQERVFPSIADTDLRLNPTGHPFKGRGNAAVQKRTLTQMFTCSPTVWEVDDRAFLVFPRSAKRNLLLSEEVLYVDSPSNAHVAAHVLAMAKRARDVGYTNFKLLAVHRAQDTRIPSHYAEGSWHRPRSSQADFEEYCRSCIDPDGEFYRSSSRFEYVELAELLVAGLGKECVAFLPLELLKSDPDRFASDLGAFIERPFDPALLAESKNVKRNEAGSWRIQPRGQAGPRTLFRRLQDRLMQYVRDSHITLPESLAQELRDGFAPGNRRLAEIFGYPLGQLGYY